MLHENVGLGTEDLFHRHLGNNVVIEFEPQWHCLPSNSSLLAIRAAVWVAEAVSAQV